MRSRSWASRCTRCPAPSASTGSRGVDTCAPGCADASQIRCVKATSMESPLRSCLKPFSRLSTPSVRVWQGGQHRALLTGIAATLPCTALARPPTLLFDSAGVATHPLRHGVIRVRLRARRSPVREEWVGCSVAAARGLRPSRGPPAASASAAVGSSVPLHTACRFVWRVSGAVYLLINGWAVWCLCGGLSSRIRLNDGSRALPCPFGILR
jgi:hypothetical protein